MTVKYKRKGTIMQPIAYVRFTDSVWRRVYELPDRRQCVEDNDGCSTAGYWYMPREEWGAMFAEPIVDEAPAPRDLPPNPTLF